MTMTIHGHDYEGGGKDEKKPKAEEIGRVGEEVAAKEAAAAAAAVSAAEEAKEEEE